MIVYDKNIFTDSKREIDSNGYLRVDMSNITKTQVAPYLGREIPNWKEFGLESDKIYYVLRPEEELKKAVPTFNNLPLTREHIEVDVENVPKEKIVGSLGDRAEYASPYIRNSLIVYDKKDIDLIMSGKKRELSCGYRYTPVREDGEFDGQHYDFRMTDIIGNHVALVKEGRAGHDVMVSDTIEKVKEKVMNLFKKKPMAEDEIPEKQDEPEKAGDEEALTKGEQEMVEDTKEVLVEDKCSAKDEEEKDIKGKEKEAFAEGVDFGEKKEKEEPKKLDSEHESEGEKKALKKKEDEEEDKKDDKKAEDKCAMDMAMDIDSIKAEAREEGRQEAIADYKAREVARKAVRKMVGDVDVFAFDSADEIYKFACEKAGVDLTDVACYKDVFKGLSARKGGLAMDASPVSGSNEECFKDIRLS